MLIDIFQARQPEQLERFIGSALDELQAPQTLTQRNFQQLMLAERVQVQFRVDMLDAVTLVAKRYGAKFPHKV